ncbi:molybdopterin-dependent oxidoreductase [bacterium]|nr:molybdopterin-dependent oxidoreductase [bacterium]
MFPKDIYSKNMLYAVCKYPKFQSGVIKNIDIAKALKIKGVDSIYTFESISNNRFGKNFLKSNPEIIVENSYLHPFSIIAVIVANSYQKGVEALLSLDIEEEEDEKTPLIIKDLKKFSFGKENLQKLVGYQLKKRDFFPSKMESFIGKLEIIAIPNKDKIKIYAPILQPHYTLAKLCSIMNLSQDEIELISIKPNGNYPNITPILFNALIRAYIIAKISNSPITFLYDTLGSYIPPMEIQVETHTDYKGVIQSQKVDITIHQGIELLFKDEFIEQAIQYFKTPYNIPYLTINILFLSGNFGYTVFNSSIPQFVITRESILDEIAKKTLISPFEIRKENLKSNLKILSFLLDKAEQKKLSQPMQNQGKAIGIVCHSRDPIIPKIEPIYQVILSLREDGIIIFYASIPEAKKILRFMGISLISKLLGISQANIKWQQPDSEIFQNDLPISYQITLPLFAKTVQMAVNKLKNEVESVFKESFKIDLEEEECYWIKGSIFSLSDIDYRIKFENISKIMAQKQRERVFLGTAHLNTVETTPILMVQTFEVELHYSTNDINPLATAIFAETGTILHSHNFKNQLHQAIQKGIKNIFPEKKSYPELVDLYIIEQSDMNIKYIQECAIESSTAAILSATKLVYEKNSIEKYFFEPKSFLSIPAIKKEKQIITPIYFIPKNYEEFSSILQQNSNIHILQGSILDISNIFVKLLSLVQMPDNKAIESNEKSVLIKNRVTIREIQNNETVIKNMPLFIESCKKHSNWHKQALLTVVGDILYPNFKGDLIPALLIYKAVLTIFFENRFQKIDIQSFLKEKTLPSNYLIDSINLSIPKTGKYYNFHGKNGINTLVMQIAFSKTHTIEKCRVASNHFQKLPMRITKLETKLKGIFLTTKTIEDLLYSLQKLEDSYFSEQEQKRDFLYLLKKALYQIKREYENDQSKLYSKQ